MFTMFCCLDTILKLKDEEETNFDLTDNMMTRTERVFLGHVLKIVHMEHHFKFEKSHYSKWDLHGYIPNDFEILT
jgi:hypothetical protein